jgi:hypothetical protein
MTPREYLNYLLLFIPLAAAVMISIWVIARYFGSSKRARAQLTTGEEYRGLADEYRRLADLAITAQEHTDLRLADLSVRIDEIRDRLDKMQRVLTEVE